MSKEIIAILTNGVFEKPYCRREDGEMKVFVADDQEFCTIALNDEYEDYDEEIAHAICDAGVLIRGLYERLDSAESKIKSQAEHVELLNQCDDTSTETIAKMDDELKELQSINKDLLAACLNSPSADIFVSFANFAEQCTEKPSMAVYKARFLCLATFLRSCVDRAEKMEVAISKADKGSKKG